MTRCKLMFAALVAAVSLPSAALAADMQEHTDGPPLLLGDSLEVGGYGSVDVAYSRMFGKDGALVGLQGALLLGHRLSLGIAGYGWTNSESAPPDAVGNPQRFETGYGGATLRYSLYMDDFPVYLTVGALFGGGAIALVDADDDDDDRFEDFDDNNDSDVFGVIQPDVSLHANLTRWLRLGVTGGYRFTSGVGRHGFREDDIDGFFVGGQVQFGRF